MIKKILPIIMIISLTGCHSLNQKLGLGDDNPIEQSIEEEIEKDTGVRVDFTPDSSIEAPCSQTQVPFIS